MSQVLNNPSGSAPVAGSLAGSSPGRILGTAVLISVNLIVFLLMVISGGHVLHFSGGRVLHWGANYGPLTLDGQPWRLISAMFVHIGLVHLLINMWCLYELGSVAEEIYGSLSLLVLYGLTGLAGGIASLARNPTIMSAGASGAIFGLAGVVIATLMVGRLTTPRRHLILALGSLIAFAAYNLTYGFLKGGVDNGAHVGGLISGFVIGLVVCRSAGQPQVRLREGLVYGLTVVSLVAGYATVKKIRGEVVMIRAARQAVAEGNPDTALRLISGLRTAPVSSEAQQIMASAYAEKKQYSEAEKCYERSLQLNPRNFGARSGLGLLLADTGHFPEASKELQKALRLEPNAAGIWLQWGRVLQKLGQHAEAVAALQKAAALDPGSVQAFFALGISEMNLRQYDAATAAFQKAIQLSPTNYDAQIWLANAYQAAGRTNDAAAAYMQAARLRRPSPARPGSTPVHKR